MNYLGSFLFFLTKSIGKIITKIVRVQREGRAMPNEDFFDRASELVPILIDKVILSKENLKLSEILRRLSHGAKS